jgi:hypothetical protein
MITRIVKLYPQRIGVKKLNFCIMDKIEPGENLIVFERLSLSAAIKIHQNTNGRLLVIWDNHAYEFSRDWIVRDSIILGRIVAEVA